MARSCGQQHSCDLLSGLPHVHDGQAPCGRVGETVEQVFAGVLVSFFQQEASSRKILRALFEMRTIFLMSRHRVSLINFELRGRAVGFASADTRARKSQTRSILPADL